MTTLLISVGVILLLLALMALCLLLFTRYTAGKVQKALPPQGRAPMAMW